MRLTTLLFAPGTRLMRSLRMPVKMALMGLFLALPLLVLVVVTWHAGRSDIRFTTNEIAGVEAARGVVETVERVQLHRGLTNRVLSGDAAARQPQQEAAASLKQALARLDAGLATYSGTAVQTAWGTLRPALQKIADGAHASQRAAAFAEHSAAVAGLRQLLVRLAEQSGLLLDPEAGTFFLMDLAVERLLPWSETIATTRGVAAAALARGDVSTTERVQVLSRMDAVDQHLADVRDKLEALERAGIARPASTGPAMEASESFVARVRTVFTADVFDGDPGALFDQGTQALRAMSRLHLDLFS
ncbi:MAG: hypothetical protein JNM26_07790, partial [Ideonella sp.]|nr:hypothetical protein [Ideonella sp.]